MSIRPVQKYQPKELYKPVRIDDIKDLFFEEDFSRYHKAVIKDYVYCGQKKIIA